MLTTAPTASVARDQSPLTKKDREGRDRVLDDREIAAIWHACVEASVPYARCVLDRQAGTPAAETEIEGRRRHPEKGHLP